MKDTPKATDAIPEIPFATPWTKVWTMSGTVLETSAFAREAPSVSTPTLTIQSWIFAIRLAQRGRDLVALGDEAADHQHHDHAAEHEQADAGR